MTTFSTGYRHFGDLTSSTRTQGSTSTSKTKNTTTSDIDTGALSKEESSVFLDYIMDTLGSDDKDSTDVLEELLASQDVLSMLTDEDQKTLNNVLDGIMDEVSKYEQGEKFTTKDTGKTDSKKDTTKVDTKKDTDSTKSSSTTSSKGNFNFNDDTKEYKKDENGNVTSMYDKTKNLTTNYKYDDNGNLVSSSTYADDGKTLMHECTYDENGRVKSKHELISEQYGTEGEFTHEFTYDESGRLQTSTLYKGTDTSADPIGTYEFKYDGDTSKLISSTNTKNGQVNEYKYDENNKLQQEVTKDKDGNETSTKLYNTNGKIDSVINAKDQTATKYEFDSNSPLLKEAKTYSLSDLGDSEDAMDKATPNKTAFYSGGKLTAEVEGEYTYVYSYDNGVKTTTKYKTSDCENGVPKKDAQAVSTEDSSSETSGTDTSSTSKSSSDAVKTAQNNSDRNSKIIQQSIEDAGGGTAWCSEFVKNVLKESGQYDKLASWYKDLPEEMDGGKNAAYSIYDAATTAGAVVSASKAKPGDIIIFKNADGTPVHTGMVEKIENGNVYTIEGGGEGGSFTNMYSVDDQGLAFCKVQP